MTTAMVFIAMAAFAILAGLKPTQRQVELAVERAERRMAPRNAGRRLR